MNKPSKMPSAATKGTPPAKAASPRQTVNGRPEGKAKGAAATPVKRVID